MTMVTVRPTSTSHQGGEPSTGGNSHSLLADDSDATWVTYDNGEYDTLGLGDVAVPAGAIVTRGVVRARSRKSLSTAEMGMVWWGLYESITVVTWTSPTTTTFAGTANPDQLNDTDIDASTITIHNEGSTFNVIALYVDVYWAVKPTVTVAIGDVTEDDTPTATLTPVLDSEGGPQVSYRVVYMASGDDPDVDTPVADSGDLSGTATEWTPSDPLPEGNYDAYAKVSQTVMGAQHESDWSAAASFTIDIPRPGLPTLGVDDDPDNARIALTLTPVAGDATTQFIEVERSTDSGETWESVRTLDSGLVDVSGGAETIWDYETGNGQSAQYRIRSIHEFASGTFSRSDWTAAGTSSWTSDQIWLKDPMNPSANAHNPEGGIIRSFPSQNRDSGASVQLPLGAKYPVVQRDSNRIAESGQLTIMTETPEERAVIDELLDSPNPLLLQFPAVSDEPDRYIAITGAHTRTRIVDKEFVHLRDEAFDWQEVDVPDGDVVAWPS